MYIQDAANISFQSLKRNDKWRSLSLRRQGIWQHDNQYLNSYDAYTSTYNLYTHTELNIASLKEKCLIIFYCVFIITYIYDNTKSDCMFIRNQPHHCTLKSIKWIYDLITHTHPRKRSHYYFHIYLYYFVCIYDSISIHMWWYVLLCTCHLKYNTRRRQLARFNALG